MPARGVPEFSSIEFLGRERQFEGDRLDRTAPVEFEDPFLNLAGQGQTSGLVSLIQDHDHFSGDSVMHHSSPA